MTQYLCRTVNVPGTFVDIPLVGKSGQVALIANLADVPMTAVYMEIADSYGMAGRKIDG